MNSVTIRAFSDEFQKIAISTRRIERVISRAKSPSRLDAFEQKMLAGAGRASGAAKSKYQHAADEAYHRVESIDAGNTLKKQGEEGKTPWQQKAKAMGGHLLAMGTGTLAGVGAGVLANKAFQAITKKPGGIPSQYLMAAAPVLGAAFGLAYNLAKAKEMEQMTHVRKDPDHATGAG